MNSTDNPIVALIRKMLQFLPYGQAIALVTDPGPRKISVIRDIRNALSNGLLEAKLFSEGHPMIIRVDQCATLRSAVEHEGGSIQFYFGEAQLAVTTERDGIFLPLDLARQMVPLGKALCRIEAATVTAATFICKVLHITYDDATKIAEGELFLMNSDDVDILRFGLRLGGFSLDVIENNTSVPF